MNISAGNVVQLRSGSVLMTVKWVNGDEAYCEWMANSEMKGHVFFIAQLELVND